MNLIFLTKESLTDELYSNWKCSHVILMGYSAPNDYFNYINGGSIIPHPIKIKNSENNSSIFQVKGMHISRESLAF